MVVVPQENRDTCQILTACQQGFGKRTPESDYPTKNRAGQGVINIDAGPRNGDVVSVKVVCEVEELMLVTQKGIVIRQKIADIRQTGRNAAGVKLLRLDKGDKLVAMAKVPAGEESEDSDTTPPPADDASAAGEAEPTEPEVDQGDA